jgi:predicted Fe-S protein YdhL (DUF1289 family)
MSIQNICVGVCSMHEQYKVCKGCYRTRLEIAKWMSASDSEKQVIIASTETKKKIYGELNGCS